MEEEKGLSDWEWSVIKHAKPSFLRKRFREEFDHLYSVGTLVDAIKNDFLLSHILAYAWKSTYHLALVCKRFWIITKSRVYWSALAKHALKDVIPINVLSVIDFFYFLKKDEPFNLHLKGLLMKDKAYQPRVERQDESIYLYYPHNAERDGRIVIGWAKDKEETNSNPILPPYILEHSLLVVGLRKEIYGEMHVRIMFNYQRPKKLVWFNFEKSDDTIVSRYVYCEIYCPNRNQTWYGQPGILESKIEDMPYDQELFPRSHSFGVWK